MLFFHRKTILFLAVLLILLSAAIITARLTRVSPLSSMSLGVSFSPEYAGSLHTDPHRVLSTILNEWQFRQVRFFAPWDKLQREKDGAFDFAELDWQMDEAKKYGARVALAVGQKTPRWPECHAPEWTLSFSREEYEAALKKYLGQVVERYQHHPALEIWQVENEPFLGFGTKCRYSDGDLLAAEIAQVKQLDPAHPTLVSDSGELSSWRRTARAADLFGATLYRVVWNKYIGYWNYDWLPASFYRLKLWLNGRSSASAYVMELQGEPWIPNGIVLDTSLEVQYRSMDLTRLQKNIAYARALGLPRSYLWGAEWWYWLKEQGHPEIAEYIKGLKK